MAKANSNSMSTRSSSLKSMAIPAEVSGEALSGSMPVASWSPHPRARSNGKSASCKSTGTVAHYPPPISKKGEAGPATPVSSRTIRKPNRFQQQSEQLLIMCWAALAWGIMVIQYPRRCCVDVSGSDFLPHWCWETWIWIWMP